MGRVGTGEDGPFDRFDKLTAGRLRAGGWRIEGGKDGAPATPWNNGARGARPSRKRRAFWEKTDVSRRISAEASTENVEEA